MKSFKIDFFSRHEEALFNIELQDNEETSEWRNKLETRDDAYLKQKIDFFVSKRGVDAIFRSLRWNVGTLLILACEHASITIVQYLIETHNANIDACNGAGTTSLMKTIQNNRLDVAKYLLRKGATPEGSVDLIENLPKSNDRANLKTLLQSSRFVDNVISQAKMSR